MENRRPYWQVAVSLLFSILATAAFIVIGIRLIGFLMPFVIGWIVASIATPLVNWLEKRMKIVKKLGSALIVILVLAAIILVSYFAVSRLVTEVTGLIRDFPDLYEQTEKGSLYAGIVYCDDHVGLFFHCAERRCHSLDERDRTRGCDKKNGYGDGQSEICSGRLF